MASFAPNINTYELVELLRKKEDLSALKNSCVERANFSGQDTLGPIIGLSGASGFLGLHMIDRLALDESVKTIHCFIRDEKKFREKKALYGLSFPEEKIQLHLGFSQERLENINNFFHLAASIHSLLPVEALWQDNVSLTLQLLSQFKERFHYISTLSVFASSNFKGRPSPVAIGPNRIHELYGGYAQSKWLGEYLVSQVPNTQIMRLGLLTPSLNRPHFQPHEFAFVFLNLIKQMRIYPENYEEAWVDASAVNLVAQQIIECANNSQKSITHIAAKKPIALSEILQVSGARAVSQKQWQEEIKKLKKMNQVLLYYAFYKTQALQKYPQYFNIDLFQTTGFDWSGTLRTEGLLQNYWKNIIAL